MVFVVRRDPIRPFIGLLLISMGGSAQAGQCTSLQNGNWNQASTWSCGRVPTGGDTVTILLGDTVYVTQNHSYTGAALQIKVYGVWYFSGGGSKITLPCGSHVEIMLGGLLLPNSNSGGHSETVRICNTTWWYYDQGPQSGYQIWPPPVLPVELVTFEGSVSGSTTLLQWITATENNSDHFELWRSRDMIDRELVDVLQARGQSLIITSYTVLDYPGVPGVWYYHLVGEDQDGSRSELGTVSVLLRDQASGIDCRPNPVDEYHLMITSNDLLTDARVRVGDTSSRSSRAAHLLWEEEHLLMLDLSGLRPGLYVAEVVTLNGAGHHCSFVVQ